MRKKVQTHQKQSKTKAWSECIRKSAVRGDQVFDQFECQHHNFFYLVILDLLTVFPFFLPSGPLIGAMFQLLHSNPSPLA